MTKTTIAIGIGAAAVAIGAVAWFVRGGGAVSPRGNAPVAGADTTLQPVEDAGVPLAVGMTEVARQEVEFAQEAPETAVLVEVRTVEDEAPVAGVRVRLWVGDEDALDEDTRDCTTDDSGRARFPLRHGTLIEGVGVWAGEETTATHPRTNRFVKRGTEERIVVHVSVGGSVAGRVVDEEGRAVPLASIRGWCNRVRWIDLNRRLPADREVTADSSGRFLIDHLGAYFALEASAPGYTPVGRLAGSIEAGQILEGVVLVVGQSGQIAGRVLDAAREPIADLRIEALPNWVPSGPAAEATAGQTRLGPMPVTATSGGDGGFVFPDLAPHPYLVRVGGGFGPWQKTHSPGDGYLEIVLSRGIDLTGRVLDADGKGMAGAEVRLRFATRRQTTTDEGGFFRFPALPTRDPIAVVVSAAGHAVHSVDPVRVRTDGPNEVTVSLEPERVTAGRVVDEAGLGIADAKVNIEGDRMVSVGTGLASYVRCWERIAGLSSARTDATGAFRFDRLYAGEFRLTATHPDDPLRKAFVTAASGTEDLVLTLDAEATWDARIVGRVTDAVTGAPVHSFQVRATSSDPGWKYVLPLAVEDEGGAYELRGLYPGHIRLSFTAPGYAEEAVPPVWMAGAGPLREYAAGEHRLDVALAPARDLAVRLVDRIGQPVGGVTLRVRGPGDKHLIFETEGALHKNTFAKLDTRGEARLHGLPAGLVVLKFGNRYGMEPRTFELDLTAPLEGVQEFVVDAEVPRRLVFELFSANPGAKGGPVMEITDDKRRIELTEGRMDVSPLAAPSFSLEVRDTEGEVCATASGTKEAEGGWTVSQSGGDRTITGRVGTVTGTPTVLLVVSAGALDIDVRAEGHRPFRVHLTPEELTPSSRTTRGWALLLERDS